MQLLSWCENGDTTEMHRPGTSLEADCSGDMLVAERPGLCKGRLSTHLCTHSGGSGPASSKGGAGPSIGRTALPADPPETESWEHAVTTDDDGSGLLSAYPVPGAV